LITTNILAKPAASIFRVEKTQHVQAAGYPETSVPSTKLYGNTFQKIIAFIDMILPSVRKYEIKLLKFTVCITLTIGSVHQQEHSV